MFIIHISGKGLLSRTHRELSKLDSMKTNNPAMIQAKDLSGHFFQRGNTDGKEAHEKKSIISE